MRCAPRTGRAPQKIVITCRQRDRAAQPPTPRDANATGAGGCAVRLRGRGPCAGREPGDRRRARGQRSAVVRFVGLRLRRARKRASTARPRGGAGRSRGLARTVRNSDTRPRREQRCVDPVGAKYGSQRTPKALRGDCKRLAWLQPVEILCLRRRRYTRHPCGNQREQKRRARRRCSACKRYRRTESGDRFAVLHANIVTHAARRMQIARPKTCRLLRRPRHLTSAEV